MRRGVQVRSTSTGVRREEAVDACNGLPEAAHGRLVEVQEKATETSPERSGLQRRVDYPSRPVGGGCCCRPPVHVSAVFATASAARGAADWPEGSTTPGLTAPAKIAVYWARLTLGLSVLFSSCVLSLVSRGCPPCLICLICLICLLENTLLQFGLPAPPSGICQSAPVPQIPRFQRGLAALGYWLEDTPGVEGRRPVFRPPENCSCLVYWVRIVVSDPRIA